jgi:hypothetical protein
VKQQIERGIDIYCQKARNVWATRQAWEIVDMVKRADAEMFRRDPALKEFTRPALMGEAPGIAILPGTVCRVVKVSATRRQRLFAEDGSEEGQGVMDIDKPAIKPPKIRRRAGKRQAR